MNQEQETPQAGPRRSRRRMRRFSIEQRRDFYVVDNVDDAVAETDFKTRAEASEWIGGRANPLLVRKESR